MRIGLFGGTFDPPHVGHFLVAVDAVERLALDRIHFIPAAVQPLKVGVVSGPAADRLEMTRRMAADDPRFGVDAVEIERDGLSFTVDTLALYAERYPSAERYFLLGADAFATLGQWREPRRVLSLARLAVLRRADAPPPAEHEDWSDSGGVTPMMLETRRVDISSTEIRARVRAGLSVRGFVPDAVHAYITTTGLYR